jgi:microcin C transport system substrate-binding protein
VTLSTVVRIILAILVMTSPAHALVRGKAVPAIAIYGEPKYPPDFQHFDYVNPDAPKGGTFIRPNEAFLTFDTFNPFTLKGAAALSLGLMHDTLMVQSLDEAFSMYGLVAQTIEIAADNSWVQFELRPEARFSDGSGVTAADVVFSFNILVTKGSPLYRIQFADVAKVEATAQRTVRFTFKTKNNRELPLILGSLPVLSEAYWKDKDFAATTLQIPVTSGPYTIEGFDVGRYITYRRKEDYWAKDLPVMRGQYNFDRVRIEYFRDGTVAFEAFKTGIFDFRRVFSASEWSRRFDFPAIHDGRVKKLEVPSILPQDVQPIVFNLRKPMFQDRRVREALNAVFDFESLNTNLFFRLYARLRSYWQGSPLEAKGLPSAEELALLEPFRDKLPPELFTQEFTQPVTDGKGNNREKLLKARALLQEAGWTIRDGQLVDKDGNPFVFELILAQDGLERVLMPWIAGLERLGIKATLRQVDTSQYVNRLNAYDYDVIYSGFSNSLAPGNEQLDYWGSEAADHPGSQNYSGVKDPVVDALARKVIEATTTEEVTTATHALDRVLTWNYYQILTYSSPVDRFGYWKKLQMPAVMPATGLGSGGSGAIALWWMDPAGIDAPQSTAGAKPRPGGRSKAGALAWVLAFGAIGYGIWRLRRAARR